MALLFIDGFDHYAIGDMAQKWTSAGNMINTSMVTGRSGSGQAISTGSGFDIEKAMLPIGDTVIVGMAIKYSTSIANAIFAFYYGSNIQCSLSLSGTNGTLVFYRGTVTELGRTDAGALPGGNVWNYLECKVKVSNTAGTVDIRVNGQSVLSLSGVDTCTQSEELIESVGSYSSDMVIDDFYLCDDSGTTHNDFLGDIRVDVHYPDGAGSLTEWSPSSGANYQCVDEALISTTDYVETTAAGAQDAYTIEAFKNSGADILGVQLVISATNVSSGGEAELAGLTSTGGAITTATSFAPSVGYGMNSAVFAVSPDTGTYWTESEFNAAEFGIEKVV